MNASRWPDYELGEMLKKADALTERQEAERLARVAEIHRDFDDAIGTAVLRPEEKTYPASWLVFFFFMAVSLGIGLGIATVVFPGVM